MAQLKISVMALVGLALVALTLVALTLVALASLDAAADSQLPVVPRTEAERERVAAVVAPTDDFTKLERFEARPGGAATSLRPADREAFSHASANMGPEDALRFALGEALFEKIWVAAPASTGASDGLGPLFNARACAHCHPRNGRGRPPEGPDEDAFSMVLRLSVPVAPLDPARAMADYLFETAPEPVYGSQLQSFAAVGHPAEGRLTVAYEEVEIALSDGETVSLRKPTYGVDGLGYGPMLKDVLLSPRVAPQMIGLGLLEAIPQADLLARADPEDADGDGISGRARFVFSPEAGEVLMGRFGLKAGAATVADQAADAFIADLGLSNPHYPAGWGECSVAQSACQAARDGGSPQHDGLEVGAEALALVARYSRNIAVPVRRDLDDPDVLRGKQVFYSAGCAQCHTPKHVTHRLESAGERGRPEQSFQLIWPYTDLLLHDMGEGLADGRPEGSADGGASGREWRTAPLWGIGLTETVTGHATFLHDGRARSLLEAVLWHGGEAQAARDRVVALTGDDRAALIRFLESL